MKALLRTLKEFDLEEVCRHLLVAGDLTGDCYNCKELGLDYSRVNSCPKCNTEFHYIASRKAFSSDAKIFINIHRRRPDLVYVDFDDLKHHKDRQKARDFLS